MTVLCRQIYIRKSGRKIKETLEREKCTKLYLYIYIYFLKRNDRVGKKRDGLIKGIDYASRENRRIILKKLAREKMRDVF